MKRLPSGVSAALSILALAACGGALAETAQDADEEKIVIEEGRTVSIEYTLKLDDGTVADTNVGGDPLVYTQGNGQILPALEKNLEGMTTEDTRAVHLSAAEGYGEVNDELYREVPPEQIPEEAREIGLTVSRSRFGCTRSARRPSCSTSIIRSPVRPSISIFASSRSSSTTVDPGSGRDASALVRSPESA